MRLIAFPVASQGRRSSSHDGRAPGFPARRRSAQRRGNTKCVAVQLCRKWMLRQTRRNPTDESHSHSSSVVFTSRVRLSIQDAPAVARAPLVVAQPGVPPCVVCRSRCQFWARVILFILRVGFLFSRLPDCGPPPRCRDRFGGQAQVPRHVNFFLGRPTVDNRRFSIGTPEEARPPRGRDHFHARIRARTAYRTAFPRAPRAHAASPSPRASRLVPSRLRPFRPPRISSPRHAR